jgi:hypothetical protein
MNSVKVTMFLSVIAGWGGSAVGLLPFVCGQGPDRESVLREVEKTFGDPPGAVRLDPQDRVWADKKNRRVIVDGYIALREGPLEMLACLIGTKEHESIVATFCKAQTVHAGLLAIGAEQGKPVQWDPTFAPPSGSEIQVFALWRGADGSKKNIDTRQWLRVVGTENEVLDKNFVFAGSMFWQDPDTGKKIYQAESGDLICVSNFSTATLDVPIESSKVNSGLMFATFTERIPAEGTPIRLVLQLVASSQAKLPSEGAKPEASPAAAPPVRGNNIGPLPDLDQIK